MGGGDEMAYLGSCKMEQGLVQSVMRYPHFPSERNNMRGRFRNLCGLQQKSLLREFVGCSLLVCVYDCYDRGRARGKERESERKKERKKEKERIQDENRVPYNWGRKLPNVVSFVRVSGSMECAHVMWLFGSLPIANGLR